MSNTMQEAHDDLVKQVADLEERVARLEHPTPPVAVVDTTPPHVLDSEALPMAAPIAETAPIPAVEHPAV